MCTIAHGSNFEPLTLPKAHYPAHIKSFAIRLKITLVAYFDRKIIILRNLQDMESEYPPLPIEDFARTYGYPTSLIRLVVDCGCPAKDGMIDYPSFIMWLVDNYVLVRAKAGLPELPPEEGLMPSAAAHVKLGNTFLTITDYIHSRASNEEIKTAAADTSEFILKVMDQKTAD
ncbi:hypothetical protein [Pedosphaera parvula]|uniref:Uncharacterized protein n=1 Tax=Pedosphaera parvula (strain Ellin514) TaxID=320771 RepID=B9X9W8_PEDPL|nr:hypothetical protein [Pedosphaera parvula]EEF63309.1 hypothetical protein Cflav_PD5944 [Pedosphaera parvula Ellin514]